MGAYCLAGTGFLVSDEKGLEKVVMVAEHCKCA
jgi:hypothetical protein